MKVTIELFAGPHKKEPISEDIDKNISALQRVVNNKPRASDFILVLDTISILEAIKKQLYTLKS